MVQLIVARDGSLVSHFVAKSISVIMQMNMTAPQYVLFERFAHPKQLLTTNQTENVKLPLPAARSARFSASTQNHFAPIRSPESINQLSDIETREIFGEEQFVTVFRNPF